MPSRYWMILLALSLTLASCQRPPAETISTTFTPGTPLKKQYAAQEAIHNPTLTISDGRMTRTLSLPLGTEILREFPEEQMLLIAFLDKRFAAFLTTGIDFIDLKTKERLPLIRGLVFTVDQPRPDLLIGVQRVPKILQGKPVADEDYDAATFTLFAMKIDRPEKGIERIDILFGDHLPDENRILTEADETWAASHFYVREGVLFYAADAKGEELKLRKLPF